MTTTALELNKRLHQEVGDHLEVQTTTGIAASTLLVSTNLKAYDGGRDETFVDWWAYITDQLNGGEDRKVRNYYTANATCNVFGAAFSANAAVQANIRLHRYSYTDTLESLNDAIRETYPVLHKEVDDRASITANSKLYEYALPAYLSNGEVRQVLINTSGATTDDAWGRIYGWDIVNAGASIRLPSLYNTGSKIRLKGITPLETVSASSDAVNIDGPKVNLLISYAKYKLFSKLSGGVSSEDKTRYENEAAKAYTQYTRLKSRMGMPRGTTTMNLTTY